MIPNWMSILLTIDFASRKLYRTQLQKMLYFASQEGIIEDTFSRGYFGPFSRAIANTIQSLVNANFIRESSMNHKYKYSLTKDGKNIIPALLEQAEREANQLQSTVNVCKPKSTESLSIAGKVHYLLKAMGVPMKYDEICLHSQRSGWDISATQVNGAIQILEELHLVKSNE